MAAIEETRVEVDGVGVFVRRVPGEGVPTVFAHGNPTHSGDWLPFLERMDGRAIAFDFPGWGASDDPSPRRFDYTMDGLADFFGCCLDVLGIDSYRLVVHDWGVVALIAAQAAPDRVDRLVIFNTVPILPGYRWHLVARYAWRVPVVGELANLLTTRQALRLGSRPATPARPGMPEAFIESTWRHYRRGLWRPMLILYRSADPGALAAAGSRLGQLRCPGLVVWPQRDPYLPRRFGPMYAERLPNAELVELDDAGHWPWLDRPDVVPRVIEFLEA